MSVGIAFLQIGQIVVKVGVIIRFSILKSKKEANTNHMEVIGKNVGGESQIFVFLEQDWE